MNLCRHPRTRTVAPAAICLGLLILLVAGAWPVTVLRAEEQTGEGGYVRNIESSPPLSETEHGPGWSYNSEYIFAISRALGDSDMPVAAKVPMFLPAIVLDTALLPVAAIAGLFGE